MTPTPFSFRVDVVQVGILGNGVFQQVSGQRFHPSRHQLSSARTVRYVLRYIELLGTSVSLTRRVHLAVQDTCDDLVRLGTCSNAAALSISICCSARSYRGRFYKRLQKEEAALGWLTRQDSATEPALRERASSVRRGCAHRHRCSTCTAC
jgi:hypothetical protein